MGQGGNHYGGTMKGEIMINNRTRANNPFWNETSHPFWLYYSPLHGYSVIEAEKGDTVGNWSHLGVFMGAYKENPLP